MFAFQIANSTIDNTVLHLVCFSFNNLVKYKYHDIFSNISEIPSVKKWGIFHTENFLFRYTQYCARNIDLDFLLRYSLLRYSQHWCMPCYDKANTGVSFFRVTLSGRMNHSTDHSMIS